MHSDAAYWAVLIGDGTPAAAALGELLDAWHNAGNRSISPLFERGPGDLANALGIPEEALAPLLALRTKLAQSRPLVERLARADVDLVARWERRYPRALKDTLGEAAPRVLWYAGSLDLLARSPVAVIGSREAPVEAVACARGVAHMLAAAGRPAITGIARAVERATLEAALQEAGGTAIVVLGQGIARAQPDLRRLHPHIKDGRLLVIGWMAPDAAWQPWLEEVRSSIAVALAERVVVTHSGESGGAWDAAHLALRQGRPLYAREAEDGGYHALLDQGARPFSWPPSSDEPLAAALDLRADTATPPRRRKAAPDSADQSSEALDAPPLAPVSPPSETTVDRQELRGESLEEAVVQCLKQNKRKVMGKGHLLQALPVSEAVLDRALVTLIAEGRVAQRPHRTGAGYALIGPDETPSDGGTFQLSLFSQDT